jgi:hypothetical protein
VEAEQRVAPKALDRVKDIRERDLGEWAHEVCAAFAPAHDTDQTCTAQLSEDAADDDGMRADAPRKGLAGLGFRIAKDVNTDENVHGNGKST